MATASSGTAIKAVIFDLGGTLIAYTGAYDSWPELETPGLRAAFEILRPVGVDAPDFEAFRGMAFELLPPRWQAATEGGANLRLASFLEDLAAACWPAAFGPGAIDRTLIEEAAAAYEWAICSQAKAVPGGGETLAQLQAAGYRLGLLSNTMFRGLAHRRDLARFGLDGYFEAMLFSADEGLWKPTPDPYLALLEQLGTPAGQAVFVGDSAEHDMVGARRAGMWSVHFPSHNHSALSGDARPDATIRTLAELPRLLQEFPG